MLGKGGGTVGLQLGCRTILKKGVEEVGTQGLAGEVWGLQAARLPLVGGALCPGLLSLG